MRVLLQPAFILHLGDIVHPVPSLPTFQEAVTQFKAIAAQATAPLHVVPGNHDVGDKKVEWMPADQVCDDYLRIYREAFGPDFYAFNHGPVRFVAVNSLLLNSGLQEEVRQREWLEQQAAECAGRRVFLFMHYPPYIHTEQERGSYDNIDEPARSFPGPRVTARRLGGPGVTHFGPPYEITPLARAQALRRKGCRLVALLQAVTAR